MHMSAWTLYEQLCILSTLHNRGRKHWSWVELGHTWHTPPGSLLSSDLKYIAAWVSDLFCTFQCPPSQLKGFWKQNMERWKLGAIYVLCNDALIFACSGPCLDRKLPACWRLCKILKGSEVLGTSKDPWLLPEKSCFFCLPICLRTWSTHWIGPILHWFTLLESSYKPSKHWTSWKFESM